MGVSASISFGKEVAKAPHRWQCTWQNGTALQIIKHETFGKFSDYLYAMMASHAAPGNDTGTCGVRPYITCTGAGVALWRGTGNALPLWRLCPGHPAR
jgi:hypothetical protein